MNIELLPVASDTTIMQETQRKLQTIFPAGLVARPAQTFVMGSRVPIENTQGTLVVGLEPQLLVVHTEKTHPIDVRIQQANQRQTLSLSFTELYTTPTAIIEPTGPVLTGKASVALRTTYVQCATSPTNTGVCHGESLAVDKAGLAIPYVYGQSVTQQTVLLALSGTPQSYVRMSVRDAQCTGIVQLA